MAWWKQSKKGLETVKICNLSLYLFVDQYLYGILPRCLAFALGKTRTEPFCWPSSGDVSYWMFSGLLFTREMQSNVLNFGFRVGCTADGRTAG